ncbi:MAG: methyltransferase domain-containing protein [Ruminococcus sp.]|nr:methyltransferase domain-containing protein [Ruminococcus sp.]
MRYICPVCGERLKLSDKTYRCRNGHSFDLASKGYVNLLLSKGRNPAKSGDNADMVRARSEFLDRGYYSPLAEALRDRTAEALAGIEHPEIIDSGCGEGYYTCRLAEIAGSEVRGIDISKHAVARCMGRAHRECLENVSFAVASSFSLPFPDSSADAVVSVFAPVSNDEYARVLKRGGKLIVVSPSPRHLFELKAAVYDTPYENRPNVYGLNKFTLTDERTLEYRTRLTSQQDIGALFLMTPYWYKTSEEGMARLRALEEIEVTCGFVLQVYTARG